MRAAEIRSHYIKISDSRAGNNGLERDLDCTLRAGRERLPAIMFLREVDARSDDLRHGDV